MNSRFQQILYLNILALTIISFCLGCRQPSQNKRVEEPLAKTTTSEHAFFKLSLAQWSLHKAIMEEKTMSAMAFAKNAKEMGFEGVEYVSQLYKPEIEKMGMQRVLDSLLAESDSQSIQNVLIMVDGEGDLADTSVDDRDRAVENHKKWVDAAQFLGCHSIRVNTFGANEPNQWHNAVVDGLTKLSKYAATKDINVLVENHGWLSSDADKLMAVISEVNLENCGTLPDFGNFCVKRAEGARWGECEEEYPDIYKGVELMMEKAKAVSAKSYDFDNKGFETRLDYERLLKIVKQSGYRGFIGVEYEGDRLSETEGIEATKNLLLSTAGKLQTN